MNNISDNNNKNMIQFILLIIIGNAFKEIYQQPVFVNTKFLSLPTAAKFCTLMATQEINTFKVREISIEHARNIRFMTGKITIKIKTKTKLMCMAIPKYSFIGC